SMQLNKDNLEINAKVSGWNQNWRLINVSFTVRLPKNMAVNEVEYSTTDLAWRKLNESMYWQDNSNLYLNVPFDGNSKARIKFSKI
ncbi:hypothetical protein JW707_03350, partial [Candidatus Woesearchaeota archaeon]|nr:hypothetical protein [Candidatus Woesearchaeota archaeon]